jgi:hypothetical protein
MRSASPPDSGREPFQYFRFLGYLAGHFNLGVYYYGRRHENTVLGEFFDVLDIRHFRIQTIFLNYVLNQVVEFVAFGSAYT